jgi:hypothetical protein
MYVNFDELSDESRVWIYQGDRAFTQEEEKLASELLQSFCEQWAAHGQPLQSSYQIDNHRFIIMAVDEDYNNPSGCSIDSSVGVMRQIQQATGIDLLDRSKVPFLIEGRVERFPLQELKKYVERGIVKSTTTTFHTLAATKGEWKSRWKIPVESTWMAKYLSKPALPS